MPRKPGSSNVSATTTVEHMEILAAIRFYSIRGWDWLPVVAFLAFKATQQRQTDAPR